MKKMTLRQAALKLALVAFALLAPLGLRAQTQLNEGFEGTTFPPQDWTPIHVSGAKEWVRTTSYYKTGSASAQMQYATSGHENYLVTPKLVPEDGEALSFYVSAQSYSGTTVTIEVSTTTPTASAFTTTLATYTTGSSTANYIGTNSISTWVQKTISADLLEPYVGQEIYIAFHVVDNNGSHVCIDDVTGVSLYVPSCPKPTDFACTAATGDPSPSATFSWSNGGTETDWVLEYSTASDFTGATEIHISNGDLNNGSYTITSGLTAEQLYYAHIKADCGGDESEWSNTIDFKPSYVSCKVIGTGSSSAYLIVTSYGCTYSQHIYTATELTAMGFTAGDIVSVSFYYSGASSSLSKTQSIYMGTTTKSSYTGSSASDFESDVTLVYGPQLLSYVAGWREYELTEPFEWDGTSNIVVGMLTNATNGNSSGWSAYGTSTSPDYKTIYRYQDYTPIDITNLASVSNGSYATTRPNINLCILVSPTPKPKNLTVSAVTATTATVTWVEPNIAPERYEYQYKESSVTDWPVAWTTNSTNLSVTLNPLGASTTYDFRVRAVYSEGESDPVEIQFTTLDNCAFPTNLAANTTPGQGTKATFSWTKGFSEDNDWVLQYGTDNTFATYTEVTTGFTVEGNTVSFEATTGITPEELHYARVKTDCGGTYSTWSDVVEFTPTNFVDYTFGETPYSTVSSVPFYGGYANYGTLSQFIIPAAQLADVAGGTIRRLTFYSSTTTASWGDAVFEVYVKEVEASSFASANAEGLEDWTTMTNVYSGSLSVSNSQMVIELDNSFTYNGGNLMIGFNETTTGTSSSVSWRYVQGPSNSALYAYKTYSSGSLNYYRNIYLPRITFNYQPTPYVKIAAINEGTITTTSAQLTWAAPETEATITGYAYQYKLSSAAEWPTTWSNLAANATSVTLQPLTAGSSYDFRIKVLYGEHESATTSTSFYTECAIVTAFPWTEDFEAYATGDFSHPCWVNENIGDGDYIYKVVTEIIGTNSTKLLKLTDQDAGTETKLRLPEMNLPNNAYQFVIDVYRNTNTYQQNPYELEGVYVYVSTDGNIEGATELAFIPRHREVSNAVIPAEANDGWFTYELPIGISGNCYIILKGVNQYITSIYMDNLTVEEIPSCARPTELAKSEVTNHSATLTWTAGDPSQNNWQVAYSKTSFDPNTASFDINTVQTIDFATYTTCTYRMDGLFDAASTYYLYIRANCGTSTEPDYGPWSRNGISLTTSAAAPAPSGFTASNFASTKVDLVWTAGGGDFETSWELYYVKSTTAPEAPAATATATKTVTTLPTTANPYQLTGLDPESKYYIWVRANHGTDGPSAWVALTGNFFETLAACPTPTGLAYNNLTAVSADLTWVGSPDVTDYTVQYCEVVETPISNEGFENDGEWPTGWDNSVTSNDSYKWKVSAGSGYSTSGSSGVTTAANGSYNACYYTANAGKTATAWLIGPEMDLSGVTSANLSFNYCNPAWSGGVYELKVHYRVDGGEWQLLKTYNTGQSSWKLETITLSGMAAHYQIGFSIKGYSNDYGYGVGIDDVKVVEVGGTWATATDNVETQSYTLSGLTGGKNYLARVKSNCTSAEWSAPISFTTLADDNKVFTNAGGDGLWSTNANWVPAGAPTTTDNAIIRANATIPNGTVATAKKVTFEGAPTATLTLADGGQLIANNSVSLTVQKSATANSWMGISAPVFYGPTNSSEYYTATNIKDVTYDLLQYAEGSSTWQSQKTTSYMSQERGYIYRRADATTLTFTGSTHVGNQSAYSIVTWSASDASLKGFNLIGNPYPHNIYYGAAIPTDHLAVGFYTLQPDGTWQATSASTPILVGQAILVKASEAISPFTMTDIATAPGAKAAPAATLAFTVSNDEYSDVAYAMFSNGEGLPKIGHLNPEAPMLSIDGYAIANLNESTESFPMSFSGNGEYTLTVSGNTDVTGYLHLVDRLTGRDIDLLSTPSYSFTGSPVSDRFTVKLRPDDNEGSSTSRFAIFDGNSLVINGEGTLEVYDVMGRRLMSAEVTGSEYRIPGSDLHTGVYVLRMNGNSQKIVIK